MDIHRKVLHRLRGGLFVGVTSLACLQTPASAQVPEVILYLIGTVEAQGSGDPLVGAIVRIEGLSPVVTDRVGRFLIEDVPPGQYAFEVEYLGRSPVSDTLVLVPGEMVAVVIRLEDDPVSLKGLEVVVEQRSVRLARAGFYDRRDKSGIHGTWITKWDMEHRASNRITDHLQNIPSIRIMSVSSPPGAIIRVNRTGNRWLGFNTLPNSLPGCEPSVYVDDLLYYEDRFAPLRVTDMNFLSPDVVEGIEVYTGMTAPGRYDAAGCGVILIWTRGYW